MRATNRRSDLDLKGEKVTDSKTPKRITDELLDRLVGERNHQDFPTCSIVSICQKILDFLRKTYKLKLKICSYTDCACEQRPVQE